MLKLLGPDGNAAPLAATETKKAHDPKELALHEANIDRLRNELMAEFVKEMSPKKDRPMIIVRDAEKVRDHYDARWREQARILNASGFPHQVDEDLIKNEIDAMLADVKRRGHMMSPLRAIAATDLLTYSLEILLHNNLGMLYLSNECAVNIHELGLTRVWLRGAREPLEMWLQGWAPEPDRLPLVEQADFTLQDLQNLLGSVGVGSYVRLPEGAMRAASTPPRKRLFSFLQPRN